MGYLNNSTITVDAILTKKGREILAQGQNQFNISHFALADDEIDYDLYNVDHPLGTAFYGAAIENLPITEALTDETQMMKYKLITLPRGTQRLPIISIGISAINAASGDTFSIQPTTANFSGANGNYGYTVVINDSNLVQGTVLTNAPAIAGGYFLNPSNLAGPNPSNPGFMAAPGGTSAFTSTVATFIGDAGTTAQLSGMTFSFSLLHPNANTAGAADRQTSITVFGNETGGYITIPITIRANP